MLVSAFFFIALAGSLVTATENKLTDDNKIPLYFSFITSINPKVGFSAAGGIPAVEIALDIINSREDILANYSLQYTEILDSECEQTASFDAFFKHFTQDNHTYIATACCGCSVATVPVAEISHYWNIPQVDFSTDLSLNDRSRFRNFFRAVPTNRNLGFGILRAMMEFGWRKMLIISQNENVFTKLSSVLKVLFLANGWIIDTSLVVNTNVNSFPLESIFSKIEEEHYKIIFVNMYSPFAYKIFCEAYHRGIKAPKYVWMTHLWYNREWWKYFQAVPGNTCSSQNIIDALDGSIGIIPDGYALSESSEPSYSGLTGNEFLVQYAETFRSFRINNASVAPVSVPNIGFDMTWILALGLDNAVERVAMGNDSGCEDAPGDLVPLEKFSYSNEKMGCILKQSFGEVNFQGLSGHILFNSNGSRPENILVIQQYNYLSSNFFERTTVAKIDILAAKHQFTFTNSNKLWSELPYDGYPEKTVDQYHIALLTVYSVMIVCGLVFAVVCLIFNIVFRKKRVLKLSSSNLNYLVILGSVILYITVFIFMYMPSKVDQFITASVICNLRIWLFSLGYTTCFAVILSKTWRVYHIFNNPSQKKMVIKDWMLLVIIGVIVLVDLIILVVGTAIDESRLKTNEIKSSQNNMKVEDDGKVKETYIYVCLRNRSGPIIWLSVSFAYKGLLQIIGIFMAFHIRKVKLKVLNDSIATATIIYANTIILITLTVVKFALDDYHNGHAAIFGLALFIDASLFLGALFVPKIYALYKDPNENKIFKEHDGNGNRSIIKTFQTIEEKQINSKLQEEISTLKRIISQANINTDESIQI